MARPRKPTAIKQMQGTLQKCRTNFNEPIPQNFLKQITPPDTLSKTAKELWNFAVEQAPEEMLASLDFSVLSVWADTMAKIMECERILQVEGMTIMDEGKGYSKPHPMLKMQNDLKCMLRGYLTELGFTPASRSKVNIRKSDEKKNDFIDL